MNTSKQLLLVALVKSAAENPLGDLGFEWAKTKTQPAVSQANKGVIKGWRGTPGNPYAYINPGYTNNPIDFADWIKRVENPRKKGYNPITKQWKPYRDVGNMSVAYGQDDLYKTRKNPNATFSDQEVNQSLQRRISRNRLRYARDKERRFDGLETAPSRIKSIVHDIMYQSGGKAPLFWNAWKEGDREEMLHQLKTYYGPDGDKKPDVRRNKLKENILREQFDSMDAGRPLSLNSQFKNKSVV